MWDGGLVRNAEPCAEIIPECDAEIGGGAQQSRKASRQSRRWTVRVPLLTLRLVTWQRISRSEPSVWSGISGRSSTIRNSGLLARRRSSNADAKVVEMHLPGNLIGEPRLSMDPARPAPSEGGGHVRAYSRVPPG